MKIIGDKSNLKEVKYLIMEKQCQKCGQTLFFDGHFGRTLKLSDVITAKNEHLVDAYVFYCSNENCTEKDKKVFVDKNGDLTNDPMLW